MVFFGCTLKLEKEILTLLVYEVRCPLKVLDEASPWEICLPTSGPDPANTHRHRYSEVVGVLDRVTLNAKTRGLTHHYPYIGKDSDDLGKQLLF